MNLDENQRKAVEHLDGPALVVAGPGSGKTTVIIERIKHLIQKHKVDPTNILAIAFTNAAAEEMRRRFKNKYNIPKICTLHVFGRDIVCENSHFLDFPQIPDEIWDDRKTHEIIESIKDEFENRIKKGKVIIYKIYGLSSNRCYIGQTIDPNRREKEHFTDSSNRLLREAIEKKEEEFVFEIIDTVNGVNANSREQYWIDYYRNKSILRRNYIITSTELNNDTQPYYLNVYKLQSDYSTKCAIGMSNQSKDEYKDFLMRTIDFELIAEFENGIIETIAQFDKVEEAEIQIENEIQKHKYNAVLNRTNPVKSRFSDQLRIEMFCKHFNITYEEVIKNPEKVINQLTEFDGIKDSILELKSKVVTGLFRPENIPDVVKRAFAIKYEETKKEAEALDFLDMLIYSAYLLEANPDLLLEIRTKYHYVFVDEFQDISPLDYRLICLFKKNLFAVGDDDQAIYGFRGGDSDIMRLFSEETDVQVYDVTRNYRSTITIVRHARALIEHNPMDQRISKLLSAENSVDSRFDVSKIESISITKHILPELLPIVTTCETNFQINIPNITFPLLQELSTPINIGILARNHYELEQIKTNLYRLLSFYGFVFKPFDSDENKKRKFILQRGLKEIEISTIHSAKGKEWDKVIILVNTKMSSKKPSLPDGRNRLIDERKLFYVAVTRARFDLVVFDCGKCQFTNELQKIPLSDQKEELLEVKNQLISTYRKKVDNAKNDLLSSTKAFLDRIESSQPQLINKAKQRYRNQNTLKLNHLQSKLKLLEKSKEMIKKELLKNERTEPNNFISKLIPILGEFHSKLNFSEENIENYDQWDLGSCVEDINSTYKQFSEFLHSYGVVPIETKEMEFNPSKHTEMQSRVFSNYTPIGTIIKEINRGYQLNDEVISKAKVVVSKGKLSDWVKNANLTQPICLVTTYGIYSFRSIRKIGERIIGFTSNGLIGRIYDWEVLFAFSKSDWNSIKPHRKSVNEESKRHFFSDTFLNALMVKNRNIPVNQPPVLRIETRGGYVLKGYLLDVGKKNIHACVNGKSVIIYRDGIVDIHPDSEYPSNTEGTLSEVDNIEIDRNLIENSEKETVVSESSSSTSIKFTRNKISDAYESGSTVVGKIINQCKGGYNVKIGPYIGFLPEFEVDFKSNENYNSYLRKNLEFNIIEFNNEYQYYVLTRHDFIEDQRSDFINSLRIGQLVHGVIKDIQEFGVFVDLGSIDGLIPRGELAWYRIDAPSEIVTIGEEVDALVIDFNKNKEEISLSVKQMTNDPRTFDENKYPVGSTVQGIVKKMVDSGSIIELENGIIGILHVSDMISKLDKTIGQDDINLGDNIEVIVKHVSKIDRRISLRIK